MIQQRRRRKAWNFSPFTRFSVNKRHVCWLGEEHLRVTVDEGRPMLQSLLPVGAQSQPWSLCSALTPHGISTSQHVGSKCQALSRVPRGWPHPPGLLSATLRAALPGPTGYSPSPAGLPPGSRSRVPLTTSFQRAAARAPLPAICPIPSLHLDSYCHPSFP